MLSRFCCQFVKWKPSRLEKTEQLEQLRALEHGVKIRVVVTSHASLGVDRPEMCARWSECSASEFSSGAPAAPAACQPAASFYFMKYIFVTGGVVSSLGKGLAGARSARCWSIAA